MLLKKIFIDHSQIYLNLLKHSRELIILLEAKNKIIKDSIEYYKMYNKILLINKNINLICNEIK